MLVVEALQRNGLAVREDLPQTSMEKVYLEIRGQPICHANPHLGQQEHWHWHFLLDAIEFIPFRD